jgi:nitrate reductase gamma subunit
MATRFLFGILPYMAAGIFLLGILLRFWTWLRTPVPLRIVATPAPKTRIGVVWRLIGDILWFPNLFKADKPLWIAGWCFHILLWLVLLRHLRYFLYPVPGWVAGIQTAGIYAGYFIPVPLAFLLGRRLLIDRTLYISILGDYFALLLLVSIALSGILLHLFFRTDLIDVKGLVNGLIHFKFVAPEVHGLFIIHFLMVMTLGVYFPFSKLVHGVGLVLSPTRNQRADFGLRFVNPWDFPVSYSDQNLFPPEKYRETLTRPEEGEQP